MKVKKEVMSKERLQRSLSIPDLTNPENGIHAINIMINNIKEGLKKDYPKSNISIVRSDPKVSVEENYDDLLIPSNNPSRSSRYTRYIDENNVLRTHTSAILPRWLKKRASGAIEDETILLPGMCYRRDVVDRTHCGEPHQMDIWRIKKGEPRLMRRDLIHLVETILNITVPGYNYRINETNHPYTINGIEIEILKDGEWLEVLECGEAHPTILKNAGLNPQEYSGLALGMGLDRLVMTIKEIDDIRILRSNDERIKEQMKNLDKYIKVSNQPATKRVLSYSASKEKTEEDVYEEVRDMLGENSSYIEEINYSEVLYEELPEKAKENLGILPWQKNIIITIVLRPLERSLPRETVNKWIESLYPKLNEGKSGYYSDDYLKKLQK